MVRNRGGLTLLELIVVMIILAMMMTIAVSLMMGASRELSVPTTVTHIESLARTARATARQEGSPAWMLFETKARRISIMSSETIWTWHFEDMTDGAAQTTGSFGRTAAFKTTGGSRSSFSVTQGKVGLGVWARADGWIEFPDIPRYHPEQGFVAEFWILREDTNATQTLFKAGSVLEVTLESDNFQVRDCTGCGKRLPVRDLQCQLCGQRMPPAVRGRDLSGMILHVKVGRMDLQTYDTLPAFAWIKVAIMFAAGEARVYVNDSLVAAKKGSLDWPGPVKLVAGARSGGFRGIFDEFRLGLVVPRETFPLPREIELEFQGTSKPDKDGNFVLHFDPEGRLERARHTAAVDLKVLGPEKQEQTLKFETNGSVKK